jgi:hypothetical protein
VVAQVLLSYKSVTLNRVFGVLYELYDEMEVRKMFDSVETYFAYFFIGFIAFKVFLILLKFIVSRSAIGKSRLYGSQKGSPVEAD